MLWDVLEHTESNYGAEISDSVTLTGRGAAQRSATPYCALWETLVKEHPIKKLPPLLESLSFHLLLQPKEGLGPSEQLRESQVSPSVIILYKSPLHNKHY